MTSNIKTGAFSSKKQTFNRTQLAAAVALVVSAGFGSHAAFAGAGWADNTDRAGVAFKQQTYYANSPMGMQAPNGPVGAADVYVNGMRDTGTPLRKFVDSLPLFNTAGGAVPNSYLFTNNQLGVSNKPVVDPVTGVTSLGGRHIPVAIADKTKYSGSDYYELAVVEYREQLHSDLPAVGSTLRGYVQIWQPELKDANGNSLPKGPQLFYLSGSPILAADGKTPVYSVGEQPHFLGPLLDTQSGTPVRVKFYNYLPTGHYDPVSKSRGGDSFLPTDITAPGAGIGPNGAADPMNPTPAEMYTQNRALLHLHGGDTPWISDGQPHSWIIPAGDELTAMYKRGETTQNVPDMPDPGLGAQTYYYPNNQSARMQWYHDHSYGATRTNVYAGEVAAYLIHDKVEAKMVADGVLPTDVIPLVYQDLTFVPKDVSTEDAKWSTNAWGQYGDLWFPHVYEVNQNPNSIDGTNPAGRWDYGPWFWPVFPAPLALPTGEYDEARGISHASGVQENYADTSLVNGVAYPNLKIEPKEYRFRLLNGSTDRFLNLGLYVAEPLSIGVSSGGTGYSQTSTVTFSDSATTGHLAIDATTGSIAAVIIDTLNPNGYTSAPTVTVTDPTNAGSGATFVIAINTEVPMVPAVQPAANAAYATNTYDGRPGGIPNPAAIGPDIVHIGTEGGWLAKANVIPSTPISYQQLRRIVTVLNVLDHGLYVGPAERADFVVDFSAYAGKTLILYNDSPAPNPGFDARVDYYTGDADQSATGGAPTTMPGQGPNTRTVMRIQVDSLLAGGGAPNTSGTLVSNLVSKLPGYFAQAEITPTVPQAWQNDAYGTSYADNLAHIYTGSAAQPSFTFNLPNDPLKAVPTFNVASVTLDSQGMGYTAAPIVRFEGGVSDPALLDANGVLIQDATHRPAQAVAILDAAGSRIAAIQVTDPGMGYLSTPYINIVSSNGFGIGAAATALTNVVSGGANNTSGLGCAEPQGSVTCTVSVQPKGIQELFDGNYGRMNATFSAELPFTAVLTQTTIPVGYIDPPTESIGDGEVQVWKITHNGVDTHPVHFHLFNVQVINRVAWDGTVVALDPAEYGWKETVKMNPLEDVYVAVKPKSPQQPFGVPQSIRPLDPTQKLGDNAGFSQIDPTTGLATTVVNELHNFNWEYVWHCHILGHEENDFMRVISFNFGATTPAVPKLTSATTSSTVTWTDPTPAGMPATLADKSNEIGFIVQRKVGNFSTFPSLPATIPPSAAQTAAVKNANSNALLPAASGVVLPANTTTWTDPAPVANAQYQVVAFNAAGYSSNAKILAGSTVAPGAPDTAGTAAANAVASVTGLNSSLGTWDPNIDPNAAAGGAYAQANVAMPLGGFPVTLTWKSNNPAGTRYTIVRSGGISAASTGKASGLQDVTLTNQTSPFTDPEAPQASSFVYKVTAVNGNASSAATQIQVNTPYAPPPDVPGLALATSPKGGVTINWSAPPSGTAYVSAYRVVRHDVTTGTDVWFVVSQDVNALSGVVTAPATTYLDSSLTDGHAYTYTVSAINGNVTGNPSAPISYSTLPLAPVLSAATAGGTAATWQTTLTWSSTTSMSRTNAYQVYRMAPGGTWTAVSAPIAATPGATQTYVDTISSTTVLTGNTVVAYQYKVVSLWTNATPALTSGDSNVLSALFELPTAPTMNQSAAFSYKPPVTNRFGTVTAPATYSANVSWTEIVPPGAPAIASYNVFRSINGATPVQVGGTIPGSQTSYTDNTMPVPVAATAASIPVYTYTVQAVSGLGGTSSANSANIAMVEPGAPTALTASYNGNWTTNATTATVGWTAAGLPAALAAGTIVPPTTGYVVTYKANAATAATSKTVTGTSTTEPATNGAVVTVAASTVYGTSPVATETLSVVVPATPTALAVTPDATTGAPVLNWTEASTAPVLGYNVLYATSANGTMRTVGQLNGAVTSSSPGLTLPTPPAGGTYYYTIVAYNDAGPSAVSAKVSFVGLPAAPGGVSYTGNATTNRLSWNASNGATSYKVGTSVNGGAVTYVTASASPYNLPAMTVGSTYVYTVEAVNAGGTSAPSTPVTVNYIAPVATVGTLGNANTGTITVPFGSTTVANVPAAYTYTVTLTDTTTGVQLGSRAYTAAGTYTFSNSLLGARYRAGDTVSATVTATNAAGSSSATATLKTVR